MSDHGGDMGLLTVRMPELGADVQPTINVVDARSLALVKTALADEQVEVPAGQYIVSSTLPSGERALGVAQVSGGAHEEVALATAAGAQAAREASLVPAPAPLLESLGPSGDTGEAAPSADLAASAPFFMRYLGVKRSGVVKADGHTEVVAVGADGGVELRLRPGGLDGVIFVQLAVPGEVPLNVALPANGMTGSEFCRLTVTVKPLTGVVSLLDNPRMDAAARYMNSGNLEQAGNLASDAESLLQAKKRDPLGAALGGYVLLRLHELPRLHTWADNLAKWFPWLPDGPIIAGEAAALKGNHRRAIASFCEGAQRGLPVFADGFSMLVSRLREYDHADHPPAASKMLLAEVARQNERLLPLSPLIDFARISLAFHGARLEDPLGSQQPLLPRVGTDGWCRFSPDTSTIDG
jgi:hypothetical protein